MHTRLLIYKKGRYTFFFSEFCSPNNSFISSTFRNTLVIFTYPVEINEIKLPQNFTYDTEFHRYCGFISDTL